MRAVIRWSCVVLVALMCTVSPAAAQDASVSAQDEEVGARPGELRLVLTPEEQREAQALATQSHELVLAYRILEVTTAATLVATAIFGAFQLYNLPTSFGVGACEGDNDPILGDYACRQSLSVVHGTLGIASLLLYVATGIVGLIAPDEDVDGSADDIARDVLTWIASIGIGLTGVLGLLARYPDVVGIDDPGDQYSFSRHMRVVHFSVATATAAAFVAHVAIDLF